MKRNSKKGLLFGTTALVAAVLGVTVISQSASNGGLFAYRAKAASYSNLAVTFNASSTVVQGSIKSTYCVLASSLEKSGLTVKASIFNTTAPYADGVISRFYADSASVDFFVSDSSAPSVTNFQNLTSISFGYASGTQSGKFKVMWSNDNSYWNTILVDSGTASQALPIGAHYVRVVNNTNTADGAVGYAQFTSFTLNYSCSDNPESHEHSISYYGFDGQDLEGIVPESLEYSAEAGKHVVIEPYYLPCYAFYYANEYGEVTYITDFEVKNGIIEFTMPDHDISIEIAVENLPVELDYIELSGQTTAYNVNDTFEFDGIVTAYYTDLSSDEVEPTDVSEPDMSTAGQKTVTVSFTDGGITKTAQYVITVSSQSTPVTLNGTYNYSSRKTTSPETSHKNWTGHMSIIFTSDGNCTWKSDRTYGGKFYDSEVYFTYVATSDGANITINLTHTGEICFKIDGVEPAKPSASQFSGGSYDRPINGGFYSTSSVNNSGVMSLNRQTLSIDTYDQASSYAYWDTLTFTLAA